MESLRIKSVEFRREREASWRELEELVTRVEKKGIRALGAAELSRLPMLYRAALSSLSVARAISLDKNLRDYLESLTARAYVCVYASKRHLRDAIADFFGRRFPRAVRRFRAHMAIAAAVLLLGAVTAFVLVHRDPDRFYTFVDAEYAQGRGPSASTEELREALYHDGGGAAEQLSAFATFLFTHNARIGMLAFALGFVVGLPVFLLVFVNGLTLGAFGALYHDRGLSVEFWGWVLPHGVTELGAVVLCGGAGLALAEALVFPGRHTRLQNLALAGREAAVVVLGAVALFLVAGLIEGIFRQTVHATPVRYGLALATTIVWAFYFARVGRREP